MSASDAFSSAETRASSASFTFSVAPSRVLSDKRRAIGLFDLTADAARLLRLGSCGEKQNNRRRANCPARHIRICTF